MRNGKPFGPTMSFNRGEIESKRIIYCTCFIRNGKLSILTMSFKGADNEFKGILSTFV